MSSKISATLATDSNDIPIQALSLGPNVVAFQLGSISPVAFIGGFEDIQVVRLSVKIDVRVMQSATSSDQPNSNSTLVPSGTEYFKLLKKQYLIVGRDIADSVGTMTVMI